MADQASLIPKTPTADVYAASGDRPLIAQSDDPMALFGAWLAEAGKSEISDPNAMTLATVDADGMPDARIVLLKDVSDAGLTFYTNLESAKGAQMAETPHAALLFHWKSSERQVRFRGAIEPLPGDVADAYFAERARDSQIGAWASDQSRPLESRAVLEARIDMFDERFEPAGHVPRPPHWGGYRLVPTSIEFWQSQAFRLHDRRVYKRAPGRATWHQARLYP